MLSCNLKIVRINQAVIIYIPYIYKYKYISKRACPSYRIMSSTVMRYRIPTVPYRPAYHIISSQFVFAVNQPGESISVNAQLISNTLSLAKPIFRTQVLW